MLEPTAEITKEPNRLESHQPLTQEQLQQLTDSLFDDLTKMAEGTDIQIWSGEVGEKPWIYGSLNNDEDNDDENHKVYQPTINFKFHIPIYFPVDGEDGAEAVKQIIQLLLTPNIAGQLTRFKVALPHLQAKYRSGSDKHKGLVIYPNQISNGKATNLSEAMRLASQIADILKQYPSIQSRNFTHANFIKPGISMRFGDIDQLARDVGFLAGNNRDLPFWEVFDDIFREDYPELFARIIDELKEYGIEERQ